MSEGFQAGSGIHRSESHEVNGLNDNPGDEEFLSDESLDFDRMDVDQLLAVTEELIEQVNSELADYAEEGRRAEVERQVARVKELQAEIRGKTDKESGSAGEGYSEGVHEAIDDIVKAMKSLSSYLS